MEGDATQTTGARSVHPRDSDHPRKMPADARLTAIAAIMALGVLRLRRRLVAPGEESAETASESPQSGDIGLELREDSRLHVRNG